MLCGMDLFIDTSFSIGKMTQDTPYYNDEELKLLDFIEASTIIDAFGENNVLFGTDSPWSDQKTAICDILSLPVSDEAKEKILYKNAKRILGI